MREWIQRHVLLTREERWIVAAVILIALTGLGVKWYVRTNTGEPPRIEQQ